MGRLLHGFVLAASATQALSANTPEISNGSMSKIPAYATKKIPEVDTELSLSCNDSTKRETHLPLDALNCVVSWIATGGFFVANESVS